MKNKQKLNGLLDIPEVKSWRAIMHAYTQIHRYLESELLKQNCSISRFQIFFYLYFEGPLPSIELAQKLNVTRGNISTFIRRLEEDELVLINQADGRGGRQLIQLTSKGLKQFENFFPDHIKRIKSVMPPLHQNLLEELLSIKIDKND